MESTFFNSKSGFFFTALVLSLLTYLLGYQVGQSDFNPMIIYYGLFFLIYVSLLRNIDEPSKVYYFLALGIFLRFLLIFAFPNLSDDIYRFIWDGRLITQGINPFNQLPGYFLDTGNEVHGLTQDLFDRLNSPSYYTIYPPIGQGIFTLAVWVSPDSYYGSALVMKGFMFLFECGSIYLMVQLLNHFKLPLHNVLIYALNPLIILEITGNLHFEGAMIFFLLLAIWSLVKQKNALSAIAFALSIVSKLLPLMFLPFLIKRLGWKKVIPYFLVLGLTLLICFSPLLNPTFISNFGNSLDLYFQKFEFNASFYYLLRWIGTQLRGYNMIQTIGPLLGITVLAAISYRAFQEKNLDHKSLALAFLFSISTYLFLATTIHPWYVAMPLALCIFTRFRFPIVWSGMIMLTYINYSYSVYSENLWVVGLEYFVVLAYFFCETRVPERGLVKDKNYNN